jgi:ketosteroid isomerase-like protein
VLGWELASILRHAPFEKGTDAGDSEELLRLDSLSPLMRARLAVDLIESNLQRLSGRLAGVKGIGADRVAELRLALDQDTATLKCAIEELHVEALFALAAADSRLGRAYALGHELADICLETNDEASFHRAFGARVVTIKDRLADLASSFPPHACRAVVLSLRAWETWSAEPELDGEELDWKRDGAGIEVALARQGELWRDLLAGDKQGQDMLDTRHYVLAARSMVKAMVATALHFFVPLIPLLILPALAFAGGVAILILTSSKALGAIFTALGAIGITGAGVRGRLGSIAGRLQSQLWGAALDLAIGEAALIGPAGWNAKVTGVEVPASGAAPKAAANLETLRKLRSAIDSGSVRKVSALLAPNATFVRNGNPLPESDNTAQWLAQLPAGAKIATQPQSVESPGPSVLVTSRKDDSAEIWWIQEGKVRYWREFTDHKAAKVAALRLSQGRSPVQPRC